MSRLNEQRSIELDDPKLDYAPLRLSDRAAKLGPLVSQGASSKPIRLPPVVLRSALLAPKAIDDPASRRRELDRRAALLSVATRIAAVAGVIAVAALLFVIMKPAFRQSVATATHWESQQLLERFLQWREKAKMPIEGELNSRRM
jgi:hypothetical protein